MLIASGDLTADTLAGQVAIVTGGGQGVGFETARALLWLGATVVLAEVQAEVGQAASQRLGSALPPERVLFVQTDVGDAASVDQLLAEVLQRFGRVDILINNATVAPLGSVLESQISDWDRSYHVNLRGPVLLAQAFLPEMIVQGRGSFICISSVGQAFMGPYEILKTAQVELADTLDAELTDSGVTVLTVAPGFSPTATALAGIEFLAGRMGMTVREMRKLVADNELSVEAAGAGVAAAAALARQFAGQEIGAIQALHAAGILLGRPAEQAVAALAPTIDRERVQQLAQAVHQALAEQVVGWQQRSFFERQWLARSFKKQAGQPVETWLAQLADLEDRAAQADPQALSGLQLPLDRLAAFYQHLQQAARGYTKDPAELEAQLAVVEGWRQEVLALQELLQPAAKG